LFIARDEELERDVAVKRIKERYAHDWRSRGELIREALITGSLEHPGIVPVYGLGYDAEGQSYYAMRLIRSIVEGDERGNTLQDAVTSFHAGRSAWTLRKLLDRFIAVCNTTQYAHDQGVLHCDLKPLNIILGPYGETLVLDWGAARALLEAPGAMAPTRRQEENGQVPEDVEAWSAPAGFQFTPAYASPEYLAGRINELSRASDVYSLGAILCCLLTGRAPRKPAETGSVRGSAREWVRSPLERTEVDVPKGLEAICRKALSRDPLDRYPSARDLADDVGHWLADEPVSAHREGWIDRLFRLARRHRAWARAGAAALLLITSVSLGCCLLVNRARRQAVELSSELAQARGMALCEQGDAQRGIPWLAKGLEILPGDASDLRRLNLLGWCRRLCSLKEWHELPAGVFPVNCDLGGRFILTQDTHGNARVWEAATGKPIGEAPLHHGVVVSAFSPDGGTILTGDREGIVRLWNTADGKLRCRLSEAQGEGAYAAFSKDGMSVLTGTVRGIARLWHAKTGQPLGPPLMHPQGIRAIALGFDGKTALLGGRDGTARLWDAIAGRPLSPSLVHGRNSSVVAVALSPDGRSILTGGTDGNARFWNAISGEPIGLPRDHPGAVRIVAFSPDGRTALTGGPIGTVWLWNAADAKPIGRPLHHQNFVRTARFSPDGRLVLTASADMTARLWDAATGEPRSWPLIHDGPVEIASFTPDGQTVLTGSADGTTRTWELPAGGGEGVLLPRSARFDLADRGDLAPGPRSQPPGQDRFQTNAPRIIEPNWVNTLAFCRSGQVVLIGTHAKVELRHPVTGARVGPTIRHGASIFSAELSPDGRRMLTVGDDQMVRIWDATTGDCLRTLAHDDEVVTATFHPHPGRRVAVTGCVDGTVRMWNLDTGQPIGRVMKHRDWVRAVAVSPDGRRLLTGCRDGTLWQWDSMTGESIGSPRQLQAITDKVFFSPDRRAVLMCAGDGTARLWNIAADRSCVSTLKHQGRVVAAAFSPSGRFLLTGCSDSSLRMWELATGRMIGPPVFLCEEIRSLAFSPDERSLLAGGLDGRARLCDLARPLSNDLEQIICWSQVITGMEIDRGGADRPLNVQEWHDRRRRLRELGGPPSF
jgi:WD40 repeat protein